MNGITAGFGIVYLGVAAIQDLLARRRRPPKRPDRITLAIGQPPTQDDARRQRRETTRSNP